MNVCYDILKTRLFRQYWNTKEEEEVSSLKKIKIIWFCLKIELNTKMRSHKIQSFKKALRNFI